MSSENNIDNSENIVNYLIDFFTFSFISSFAIPKRILFYFFKDIEVMDYIYQPDIEQILLDKEKKVIKKDTKLIPFISIEKYIQFEQILFKENAQYPFLIFDYFLLFGIVSIFISIIHIFIDKNDDSFTIFIITNLCFLFFIYIFLIVFISSGNYIYTIIYIIITFLIYYFFCENSILKSLMLSISTQSYYFLGNISRCYSFKNVGKEKNTLLYNTIRFCMNFLLFIFIISKQYENNETNNYLINILIIIISIIELYYYHKLIQSRGIFVRDEYYEVMKGILLDDKYKDDLYERKVMTTTSFLNVSIVEFVRNESWQCLIYFFSIFPMIYFKLRFNSENYYYEMEKIKCGSFILIKIIIFIKNFIEELSLSTNKTK